MESSLGMKFANHRNSADYYLAIEFADSSMLKSDLSVSA